MIRLTLALCTAVVLAAALSACAQPQNAIAVDCHAAAQPCGVVVLQDGTHAMSAQPVTVPVSAVPGTP